MSFIALTGLSLYLVWIIAWLLYGIGILFPFDPIGWDLAKRAYLATAAILLPAVFIAIWLGLL